MIYLNNAATTYPKPQNVLDACSAALRSVPESQFRSGRELTDGEDVFTVCKRNLGKIMGLSQTERIYLSSGATDSANRVLYGLLSDSNDCEKKIITTVTEHNSILRPLYNHQCWKKRLQLLPCDRFGYIDPGNLEKMLTINDRDGVGTEAVIINHCSNVTGMVQDLAAFAEAINDSGLRDRPVFIVDASQSAGCIPFSADDLKIDALIFTGHKSLFGVQGTGGYYVRNGLELRPMLYGGTGRNSAQIEYSAADDDYEYEVGTQNGPGIAALCAGTEYILSRGVNAIAEKEREQMRILYDALGSISNVKLYGCFEKNAGPVLSFVIDEMAPSDVAYILKTGYDVTVRTGLHCAPLIHDAIGSGERGTVRISISDMTQNAELEDFINIISEIAEAGRQI